MYVPLTQESVVIIFRSGVSGEYVCVMECARLCVCMYIFASVYTCVCAYVYSTLSCLQSSCVFGSSMYVHCLQCTYECVYAYSHMHACTGHVHIHTHTCMHVQDTPSRLQSSCFFAQVCMCIVYCAYTNVCTHTHTCMHVHALSLAIKLFYSSSKYVCMHIQMCVHIFTHACMHRTRPLACNQAPYLPRTSAQVSAAHTYSPQQRNTFQSSRLLAPAKKDHRLPRYAYVCVGVYVWVWVWVWVCVCVVV
jgi:hypothetical protein